MRLHYMGASFEMQSPWPPNPVDVPLHFAAFHYCCSAQAATGSHTLLSDDKTDAMSCRAAVDGEVPARSSHLDDQRRRPERAAVAAHASLGGCSGEAASGPRPLQPVLCGGPAVPPWSPGRLHHRLQRPRRSRPGARTPAAHQGHGS